MRLGRAKHVWSALIYMLRVFVVNYTNTLGTYHEHLMDEAQRTLWLSLTRTYAEDASLLKGILQ